MDTPASDIAASPLEAATPQGRWTAVRGVLREYSVHVMLLVATAAGIFAWWEGPWTDAAYYAGGLLTILLAHEMGHYLAARAYGVDVTLPYFLPGLPPFYTFGAFIKMRAHKMRRRALLVIGAAGPLAGAVVAIPVYITGVALSETIAMPPMTAPNELMIFGDSILSSAVAHFTFGALPPGTDVMLHPLAYAGWVGLFVTALNLVPVGQLDGGHIGYALFGKDYAKASRWFFRALIVAGIVLHPVWIVLSIFLLLTGVEHPPIVVDEPLPRWAKVMGYLCFGLFALTFIPVPIHLTPLHQLLQGLF